MSNDRYIVIVGCGRVGSQLANLLSSRGNSVVVVDQHEKAFANLSAEFSGFRITGDATHIAVLRQAKLEGADVFIATTHADNVNLMTAQVAKTLFKVPRIMARVYDPAREDVYTRLGIETVCPTREAARLIYQSLDRPDNPREAA